MDELRDSNIIGMMRKFVLTMASTHICRYLWNWCPDGKIIVKINSCRTNWQHHCWSWRCWELEKSYRAIGDVCVEFLNCFMTRPSSPHQHLVPISPAQWRNLRVSVINNNKLFTHYTRFSALDISNVRRLLKGTTTASIPVKVIWQFWAYHRGECRSEKIW